MIMTLFNAKYIFDVVCIAVAFFTFLKLISNNVYLTNHRILPVIAGVITVYDFYHCVQPFYKQ